MTEEQVKKYGYMFSLAEDKRYPISFGWECSEGWIPLITDLIEKLAELDTEKQLRVHQIKEKFGGLRFYINSGTEEMYNLINEAEEKSYHTCEVCGKEGKLREDLGWIKTLCDDHYDKEKNRILEMKSRRIREEQKEVKNVTVNAPTFKLKMKG